MGIFALIFRKLPCPQTSLTTRLQDNRNSSEIFLRLFLWFKFISQMFKAATKNVSLEEMLRLNFLSYFFFVLFLFKHIASLNYRKILKRYFRRNSFLIKVTSFYFPAMITQKIALQIFPTCCNVFKTCS